MKHIVLSILALLITSSSALADPVMDRINKEQTIRCGYVSYSPASVKDIKTGEMKGLTVDVMEEAARRMALKVTWGYETNWPTVSSDLQTDKFDLACVTYWSNPRSARQMLESIPVFYQPVFFITRADDRRFDDDITKVNDPSVSVSILEGDVPETILDELYPQAKRVALPQNASFSQVFQEVASGRADITIAAKPDMDGFAASNPGVLKIITAHPVRLYANVMLMPPGADQLKNALDATLREMQLDGTIGKMARTYAHSPHDYYLIDHPYSKIEEAGE